MDRGQHIQIDFAHGINNLGALVATEVARSAIYRPVNVDEIAKSKPREIVGYNLMGQRHLKLTDQREVLPSHFMDVNANGLPLLYTALASVAHMNYVKGTHGAVPNVRVRTFVEPLFSNASDKKLPVTVRIFHMSFDHQASAGPAAGTTVSEHLFDTIVNHAAADESSEAMEMSAEGNDGDEEAIRRKDKRALDASARKVARSDAGSKRRETFVGGFEAVLRESEHFASEMTAINSKPGRRQTAYRGLIGSFKGSSALTADVLNRRVRDHILAHTTPQTQYQHVLREYLSRDVRRRTEDPATRDASVIDDGDVFFDTRACANFSTTDYLSNQTVGASGATGQTRTNKFAPYQEFDGRINPEHVLSPTTAMVYHTEGVNARQRDIGEYFRIADDAATRVLAHDPTYQSGATNAGLDSGDLIGLSFEDLESMNNGDRVKRAEHLRRLFTEHPERIRFMQEAGIRAADFCGFPYPEHVYEIDYRMCRPETALCMPLPYTMMVPLGDSEHINSPEYTRRLLNMVRSHLLVEDNNHGRIVPTIDPSVARDYVRQQGEQFVNQLRAALAPDVTDNEGRLTPEGLFGLVRRMLDYRERFGISIETDFMFKHQYARFDELVVECNAAQTLDFENRVREHCLALQEKRSKLLSYDVENDDASMHRLLREMSETDAESIHNMRTIREANQQFAELVEDANAHLRHRDPEAAARIDQEATHGAMADMFGSVPEGIMKLDDALIMARENLADYARLNAKYQDQPSNKQTRELYGQELRNMIRAKAKEALAVFLENNENIDTRSQEAVKWFNTLTPEQKRVDFKMPFDVRPYTGYRIYINESLASPAVNASQNATALLICYFGRLHHCRWYIDANDPKTNILLAGDGMSGKSYILHTITHLSPTNVCVTVTHMSNHAMHVETNNDGFCYLYHEFQHRYLFPAVAAKDGGSAESGDALTFFKDRLTRGRASVIVQHIDKETGKRSRLMFECSDQSLNIGATNDALSGADENVLSRFVVLSVPKPREQAEGSNPSDRPTNASIDARALVMDHYAERIVREHRLLHFRYMLMEFLIKACVIPDGIITYGARILLDNIFNEMMEKYAIDTRDPRKRKITEEMARSMAGHYACYMSLGSPLARWYYSRESAPDPWSSDAIVDLLAPFMFVGKDQVIDAVTLLEMIWAPQYQTRILHTVAFSLGQLHNMNESTFRRIYHHAHAGDAVDDVPGESFGNPAAVGARRFQNLRQVKPEVDYRYVAIEDQNSYSQIDMRIADMCSKWGIRVADVKYVLQKWGKQYHNIQHLVPDAPAAGGSGSNLWMPTVARAFAPSNGSNLADAIHSVSSVGVNEDSVASLLMNVENTTDREERAVANMERAVNNSGSNSVLVDENSRIDAPIAGARHAGIKLKYDTSRPAQRELVAFREPIDPAVKSRGWRLCVSVAFLMQHLKFDIRDHESMRQLVANDRTRKHAHMPAAKVEHARPEPGSRWGRACDVNFAARVDVARKIGFATTGSTTSPVVESIRSVLENAYLEVPDKNDEPTYAIYEALKERYERAFKDNRDPSKVYHPPWLNYVTSIPVSDYVIDSMDSVAHPEGRQISFFDMLRVLPLTCDPKTKRPVKRINYARTSLYSKHILDFERSGDFYDKDTPVISATDRYRSMNNSTAVGYYCDIDHYEAMNRANTLAFTGFRELHNSHLMAYPIVTYRILRELAEGDPDGHRTLGNDPTRAFEYPEEDPKLTLEYPTHQIVRRIREFETRDRLEALKDYSYVMDIGSVYKPFSFTGALNFQSDDRTAETSCTPAPLSHEEARVVEQLVKEQNREVARTRREQPMFTPESVRRLAQQRAEENRAIRDRKRSARIVNLNTQAQPNSTAPFRSGYKRPASTPIGPSNFIKRARTDAMASSLSQSLPPSEDAMSETPFPPQQPVSRANANVAAPDFDMSLFDD